MATEPSPITDPHPARERPYAADATRYICLNGKIMRAEEACVSVLDHGLLYGDGLFETLRIVGGRCFQAEAHLQRLHEGADRLRIALPWTRSELHGGLRETAAANAAAAGALRLTVTRGAGPPVPSPSVCDQATYFITYRASGVASGDAAVEGIRLALGPTHPRLFVPGIKSLCYLPYQSARVAALADGFDDALLHYNEHAVETSVSNVFAVMDGQVVTPDLDSGCLPGITRALVLRLCADQGIPCRERSVALAELPGTAEFFVTNSLQGVLPVVSLGAARIADGRAGPITRALQAAYQRELEHQGGLGL